MANIHDIPTNDIEIFLKENGKNVNNIYMYEQAMKLMKKTKNVVSYHNVPINIVEWKLAYDLYINNIDIPTFSFNEIQQLSDDELCKLSKLLKLECTNITTIINILKYLRKIGDNDIIINNVLFPKEVICNILNNLDNRTISSILSTCSQINKLSLNYKNEIFLSGVQRELNHVSNDEMTYDTYVVPRLKYGDRLYSYSECFNPVNANKTLFICYNNYVVVLVDKNNIRARVKKVDVLGNVVSKSIPIEIRYYNKVPVWRFNDNLLIKPGILLFDNGPIIEDINSPYLIYKTVPRNVSNPIPESDMIVTVHYRGRYQQINSQSIDHLYVIDDLSEDYMSLMYIGDDDDKMPAYVQVGKFKGKWDIINDDIIDEYGIILYIRKIGGFINHH
jgi:hypothetical protein